jgi:hypothetical protein
MLLVCAIASGVISSAMPVIATVTTYVGTGQQIDYLRDPPGKVMAIDGLWAIF